MGEIHDIPSVVADRFEVRGVLGKGGMGVVTRAYDRRRRHEVALKCVRESEGTNLLRFKREFRSLADIVHTNLVTLYELVGDDERLWFSMELVRGTSFLSWVRPATRVGASPTESATTLPDETALNTATATFTHTAELASDGPAGPDHRRQSDGVLELDRLTDALRGLLAGVAALHDAERLHCDLKPSNVLLDASGRAVVCDFGLVFELSHADPTRRDRIVGTPAYMSPEQALGEPLTEASDWYSVGVMLYEALSGARPFQGTGPAVVEAKQARARAPEPAWDASAPVTLRALAMALLEPVPSKRPTRGDIEAVLRRLDPGCGPGAVALSSDAPSAPDAPSRARAEAFVGREREVARVLAASEQVARRGGTTVVVSGPSGVGKSALVAEVRRHLEARGALWLEGRCYERESMPFKALDALVDALSAHLAAMAPEARVAVVPRDAAVLARLFPVMTRIEDFAADPRARVPRDPQELRSRAVLALRYLLNALARQQPLVVFIDDLQWGDRDSAAFLAALAHDPMRPPALFVATCRAEELDSPLVAELLAPFADGESPGSLVSIELGALSPDECRELVRALQPDAPEAVCERIVNEAHGSPYWAAELAMTGRDDALRGLEGAGQAPGEHGVLDAVVGARVDRLDADPRSLVQAVAVAGRPLPAELLGLVAGVSEEARALAALRSARLVRAREHGGRLLLEPYHDRVREAVVATLDPRTLTSLHERLALALEASSRPDPLALVDHWMGAGDSEQAGRYALEAAGVAADAFAFARAAALWQLALDTLDLGEHERRRILERRGWALQAAGELRTAAEAFGAAADGADEDVRIDLMRRQSELLLHAGDLDRGIDLAEACLRAVGVKPIGSARAALASIALSRARLAVRGFSFEPVPEDAVDARVLRRLDVLSSAADGMALTMPLFGMAYQARRTREALDAGEVERVTRALIPEIGFASVVPDNPRLPATKRRARELAEASGPATVGIYKAACGLSAWLQGDFAEGLEYLRAGRRDMLEYDASLRWQTDRAITFELSCLLYLGRIRELCEQVPLLLRDARGRGNEFLARALGAWRSNVVWLFADDVVAARQHSARFELLGARRRGFQIYDVYVLGSRILTELYDGQPREAYRLVREAWPRIKKSRMLRMDWLKVDAGALRARAALALAARGGVRRTRLLAEARAAAALCGRARFPLGRASAALLAGCADLVAGERARAEGRLQRAIAEFEAGDMALFAAVARWRWGEALGGADGAAALAAAREYFEAEGVVAPERIVDMYAPVRE